MCGICGAVDGRGARKAEREVLLGMVRRLFHRGPDEQGIAIGPGAALGHARLSIIDLAGGRQPMTGEDHAVWVVFNGEIYNYLELIPELEARGHRFRTRCDTEVLVHLWEEEGPELVHRLNGQFAFALWDARSGTLFMARDPVGVRPLHYVEHEGWLLFASEIKALFAWPGVPRALDPGALRGIFTLWGPAPGRTAFKGVRSLPPGHRALFKGGRLSIEAWYRPWFDGRAARGPPARELAPLLKEHLLRSARLRLRADVPVGAYLSGGLDSSVVVAAVMRYFQETRLATFSIRFADAAFDEGGFQRELAAHLGTDHHEVLCSGADIGAVFPAVVEHAECPLLRTAPAPMFLLSRLVRQNGYKVVLTGEGADEFLGGYDLFREAKIRNFWARDPGSQLRPRLLTRLYPWMKERSPSGRLGFAKEFFGRGIDRPRDPGFSHIPRWDASARLLGLLSSEAAEEASRADDPVEELLRCMPPGFEEWGWLARAQALEVATVLSSYILSSQGDRMLMGNSVEGRFPFLDPELIAFAGRLPPGAKLRGLDEKFLLKLAMGEHLPRSILERPKQPYRAPDAACFIASGAPEWVGELLSERALRAAGLFSLEAAGALARKCARQGGAGMSNTDNMSIVGILSAMLLHERMVAGPRDVSPPPGENLAVDVILPGRTPPGPGRGRPAPGGRG